MNETTTKTKVIIYKGLRSIEAQAVNSGKTIVGKKFMFEPKKNPTDGASKAGEEFAKLVIAKKITEISFDRNGSRYHGRVKAFADGMRNAGLKF